MKEADAIAYCSKSSNKYNFVTQQLRVLDAHMCWHLCVQYQNGPRPPAPFQRPEGLEVEEGHLPRLASLLLGNTIGFKAAKAVSQAAQATEGAPAEPLEAAPTAPEAGAPAEPLEAAPTAPEAAAVEQGEDAVGDEAEQARARDLYPHAVSSQTLTPITTHTQTHTHTHAHKASLSHLTHTFAPTPTPVCLPAGEEGVYRQAREGDEIEQAEGRRRLERDRLRSEFYLCE